MHCSTLNYIILCKHTGIIPEWKYIILLAFSQDLRSTATT